MAHQTPQYLTGSDPEHLYDSVMVKFPFCGLFSGLRKKHDPSKGNDAMDSIEFPQTTAGPRTKRSAEEMQGIIDRLHAALDDLSLLERFQEEVEDLRENPPDMEMNDTDRENLRLQDAVKISTLAITYWEEEWTPNNPQAKSDFPIMEKAAQLMGDLMEGIQDEVVETWDGVGKVSIQRARIWLQSGAFDRNSPYKESYVMTGVANDDGAGDTDLSVHLEDAGTRFRCNQCPETFNQAVKLEDHLRQDHGGHGVGMSLGKTLRHRVLGTLTCGVGTKWKAENKQTERGDDSKPRIKKPEPISSTRLGGGWLNITPLQEPLLQPVKCPTCLKTYTSSTALRNHRQTKHNDITESKPVVDPMAQSAENSTG